MTSTGMLIPIGHFNCIIYELMTRPGMLTTCRKVLYTTD